MFSLCLSPARKKANIQGIPQPSCTPTPQPGLFGYFLLLPPSRAVAEPFCHTGH